MTFLENGSMYKLMFI